MNNFSAASNPHYHYENGDLFLGLDGSIPIGIKTPRHAITIAGARSGKGVACIIPNLKRWPHNALVIDPKGEAAEETAKDREAMGQSTYVVDPFNDCNVEDRFRATYNPLDDLDLESFEVREDILTIADGIVMRHNPEHARWDNAGVSIIAGLIAFVKIAEQPEKQNLIRVREILTDQHLFNDAIELMTNAPQCEGMMKAAATIIRSQKDNEFTENAISNTEWLDSRAMKSALVSSSFSLSQLKNANTSIFLVLPVNRLGQQQHGRFLRLFVRCSIDAMQKRTPDGKIKNKKCLFILDEFFSLGRINEIAEAAGQMPGFGLHLWPFLQDLGQLISLYGRESAETFFGNSDLHQFFGNTDQTTLEYMSKLTGTINPHELGLPPSAPVQMQGGSIVGAMMQGSEKSSTRAMGAGWGAAMGGLTGSINAHAQANYQDEMNAYQQRMSIAGRPRYSVDEIAQKVQRRDDDVADNMFCLLNGADRVFIKPLPYFRALPKTKEEVTREREEKIQQFEEFAPRIVWKLEQESPFATAVPLSIGIAVIAWPIIYLLIDPGWAVKSGEWIWVSAFLGGVIGVLSLLLTWPFVIWAKKYAKEEWLKEQWEIFHAGNHEPLNKLIAEKEERLALELKQNSTNDHKSAV